MLSLKLLVNRRTELDVPLQASIGQFSGSSRRPLLDAHDGTAGGVENRLPSRAVRIFFLFFCLGTTIGRSP